MSSTQLVKDSVFICGAPRTGTTLLLNLLDWNSKYLIFPIETHILYLYNYLHKKQILQYFLRDYIYHNDIKYYIDKSYQKYFHNYIENVYGKHSVFLLPNINRQKFIDTYYHFVSSNIINDIVPINVIYNAIYYALKNSTDIFMQLSNITSFIEKRPLDNEVSAVYLKKMFPDAKFIHILRDPRTRYISAKVRRIKRFLRLSNHCEKIANVDFPTAHSVISAMSLYFAKINSEILKKDYFIIKFEDLISEREKVMEQISRFLGIDYSDILSQQTRFGKNTYSESSFQEKVSGKEMLEKRLEYYNKRTSVFEKYILNFYCSSIAKEFGYNLQEVNRLRLRNIYKILKPIRNEPFKHYIGNRRVYFHELRENPNAQLINKINSAMNSWFNGVNVLAD